MDQLRFYSPCTLPRTQTNPCIPRGVLQSDINTSIFSSNQKYKSREKMEQHLCFPGMSDSIQTTLSRSTLRCFAPYCSQHQTGSKLTVIHYFIECDHEVSGSCQDQPSYICGRKYFLFFNTYLSYLYT